MDTIFWQIILVAVLLSTIYINIRPNFLDKYIICYLYSLNSHKSIIKKCKHQNVI